LGHSVLRTDRPTTDDLTFGKISNGHKYYLREGSSDPLHVWFYGGIFEVGGSNGAWRYFRFRQIQDGGTAAILENSNGDISTADHPIYSVFGSRVGFSGSADRMALIPV